MLIEIACLSAAAVTTERESSIFRTRAWFGKIFPEAAAVKARASASGRNRSTALCFSGGGVRSYSASIGELRGLLDLGLIDNVDYIGGVSGGAWASSVFQFYRRGAKGVAQNDVELLGDLVSPANETLAKLSAMPPPTSARLSATKSLGKVAMKCKYRNVPLPCRSRCFRAYESAVADRLTDT